MKRLAASLGAVLLVASWIGNPASACAAEPPQEHWRFCNKCFVLFFDGFPDQGSCAGGGSHVAQGLNFALPYGDTLPETSKAQVAWRFCGKCHGMFFDGFPDKGHCPAGGAHTSVGYHFRLAHDIAAGATSQSNWRYCGKCHAMFFDGFGTKGRCAAGGAHAAAGFMFVLAHNDPVESNASTMPKRPGPASIAGEPLLVTGMEVSVKGRVLAGDSSFLSENSVCSPWNAHLAELNAYLQNQAISQLNALIKSKLHRDDIGIRTSGTHLSLSNACSFRAEVIQACQNSVDLHLLLPGNSFQFYFMTPGTAKNGVFGDSDPKFTVRADFDVKTSVRIPTTPGGTLGVGSTNIKVLNFKLESHNVTADVIKGLTEILSEWFTGRDIIETLSQDRMFKLDAVGVSLQRIAPALHSIPSNYHIDACLGNGNVFRLDGTDVVEQGPIVK